jgi:hypothetical protein
MQRVGCGVANFGSKMYMFGGDKEGAPTAEVHLRAVDGISITWTDLTLILEGPQPLPRQNMGFAAVDSDDSAKKIVMFGGIGTSGSAPMNDLWELDTLNLMWTPLNFSGTPSARHSPGFISLSTGRILLYGGQDAEGMASSELLILDLAARAWTPLAAAGVCSIGTLSPRACARKKRFVCVCVCVCVCLCLRALSYICLPLRTRHVKRKDYSLSSVHCLKKHVQACALHTHQGAHRCACGPYSLSIDSMGR